MLTFCFFSAQYLPTIGGVERYTFSLAKQLVDKGHKAIIITSFVDNLPLEETDENGIIIYRLPAFLLMGGRFPVIKPCCGIKQLLKKLKTYSIDFCVIQTRFYTNSIFGAWFADKINCKSIVVEHGSAHLIQGGIAGFLGNIYEHATIKIINHWCKDFYGVSKCCCKWLEHFNIKSDKVLYNAVDIFSLQNEMENADTAFIQQFIGKKIVCFVGRLIPEKGVLSLVEAFKEVKRTNKDCVLALAGDGPLMPQIENLATENIYALGAISHGQTLALMKNSEVFCLPTFSEGFATTVLEAAAMGTPIITTDTGGSGELMPNESFGILLKDTKSKTISTALNKALSDNSWRKTAADNAYHQLIENFTWDKVSDKLIEIAQNNM